MKFIRNTLGFKLTILYILLFIISFGFIHVHGTNYVREKVVNDTVNTLQNAGEVILTRHIQNQTYTSETIRNFQSHIEIGAETVDCRIVIIGDDGDILLDTSDSDASDNIYKYNSSFLQQRYVTNLQVGTLIKEKSLCVNIPVTNCVFLNGNILLLVPMSTIDTRTTYYFNICDILFYIIMGCLFVIFLLIYISNAIPLRHLTKAAKAFSIRRDNPPIHIRSNDEYRDMAETLNIIGEEMSKFDEYQKSFIANISHDFRSPLTSIRGYAEAMLDGTIPYENQEKYLNVILFETDRLNHLTSNLLQLNTFDADKVTLNITTFNLHYCIRKTVDTLSGVAHRKGIEISISYYQNSDLYVQADQDKINQVLHNLLDNAIKFSELNSTIEIKTTTKGEKVFVSIKDHGIGISKDAITKVWERFYKDDSSRGKDKKGTGLGLCICREIIEAHNENINVVSTEGVGSEFVFTLPKGAE